jgi:hypothetical protein
MSGGGEAMSSNENFNDYVSRLQSKPERGNVLVIRVTNKRSIPLVFQIEPTGDLAEPLQPNDHYLVVSQDHINSYGTLDIWIGDDQVSVWVEGADGQVFHDGESVAY